MIIIFLKFNMKKNWLFLICVISICSCKKINNGFPKDLIPEVSYNNTDYYKFTILNKESIAPIIEHKAFNQNYYMAIHSGATYSAFLKPRLESIVSKDALEIAEELDPFSGNRMTVNFTGEKLLYTVDPLGKYTTGKEYNSYDGILGQDYLRQYKNVVFDYKNNKFYVNQKPITDISTPMYMHNKYENILLIDIIIDDEKLKAIIDTGSKYIICPNKKSKKVNLKINSIEYKDIKIIKTNKKNTSKKNIEMYKNENIIGYPCFKDHVIQLDFENNVFRIK